MSAPLLEAIGLTKRYVLPGKRFGKGAKQIVHAVEEVSFQVPEAGTLGLVGESGCGKSTTAKLLLRPSQAFIGTPILCLILTNILPHHWLARLLN